MKALAPLSSQHCRGTWSQLRLPAATWWIYAAILLSCGPTCSTGRRKSAEDCELELDLPHRGQATNRPRTVIFHHSQQATVMHQAVAVVSPISVHIPVLVILLVGLVLASFVYACSGNAAEFFRRCILPAMERPSPSSKSALCAAVEAMPLQKWEEVSESLSPAHGVEWSLSTPLRSHYLVRLQAQVMRPDTEDAYLTSPLTRRECVCYSVCVSRGDGGKKKLLAQASKAVDFSIVPIDAESVRINVSGSAISMFCMSDGVRIWNGTLASAPRSWQTLAITYAVPLTPSAKTLDNKSRRELRSSTYAAEGAAKANSTSMEFKECALLADSYATFVGELHRDEKGVLQLLPYEDPLQSVSSSSTEPMPRFQDVFEGMREDEAFAHSESRPLDKVVLVSDALNKDV